MRNQSESSVVWPPLRSRHGATAASQHDRAGCYQTKGKALPYKPGCSSVLLPADRPFVLARNHGLIQDGVTMAPMADGADLFVRFQRELVCLARTTDAGRKYEAETVATTLLEQLQQSVPDDDTIIEAGPCAGLPYQYEWESLLTGELFTGLEALGPYPAAEAAAAAATLGFPGKAPWVGKRNFEDRELISLSTKSAHRYPQKNEHTMIKDWRYGKGYDLVAIHKGQPGSVCLWATIDFVDRERVLRLDLPTDAVRLWIGGVEVKHNQRVRLKRGFHRIAIQSTLPADAGKELAVRPKFWPADDFVQETAQRLASLKRVQPYLAEAVEFVPNTPAGKQSAALLLGL